MHTSTTNGYNSSYFLIGSEDPVTTNVRVVNVQRSMVINGQTFPIPPGK